MANDKLKLEVYRPQRRNDPVLGVLKKAIEVTDPLIRKKNQRIQGIEDAIERAQGGRMLMKEATLLLAGDYTQTLAAYIKPYSFPSSSNYENSK